MLATLLLLAQLVLPWPGLDSPLVQPGPTICVGACAGPVVWGPAERGRLVVACDMRSDTCSDGRQITTTRATPVPCETSPGVWTEVGVNQGCYSVRGLDSWAQNTSYLSYGAELDRSPWGIQGDAEIMQIADGFRVCHTTSSVNSGIRQSHTIGLDETATLSVIARRNTASGLFLSPFSNGGGVTTMSPAGWGTYSRTETRTGAATAFIYPRPGGVAQCVDLLAAWLTRTNNSGRACWGGEAPVTCAADLHTISTEGWPTESGEISFAFQLDEAPSGTSSTYQYILDSRVAEEGSTFFAVRGDGRFFVGGGVPSVSPLPWDTGTTYSIRVRAAGGAVRVWRNGVLIHEAAGGFVWGGATARLGARHTQSQHLNGSIRSLTVRSYEEVSP